ncbi:hypothetical protein SRHO_G00333250 [Serrasalmus rhombeus]
MGNEASLEGGDVVGMAGAPGSVSAPPGSGQLHKPVNGAAAGAPMSSECEAEPAQSQPPALSAKNGASVQVEPLRSGFLDASATAVIERVHTCYIRGFREPRARRTSAFPNLRNGRCAVIIITAGRELCACCVRAEGLSYEVLISPSYESM